MDKILLALALGIVLFGLIMVYSSSFIFAQERAGDGYVFIRKQIIFAILGFAVLFLSSHLDHQFWFKTNRLLLLFTTLLLGLVMVPGIGIQTGGAQRWIHLGFFGFQPGELLKFSVVVFVASQLTKKRERFNNFSAAVLSNFILVLPALTLLLFQPDFGTTVIVILSILSLMFIAGVPFQFLALTGFVSAVSAGALVAYSPYRLTRFLTFLDPWKDPTGKGFQVLQSLVGVSNGKFSGVGLGNGKEKLFFLPEAHNDFIFAVIGEELGFIGIFFLVLVFTCFFYRGFKIAWKTYKDCNNPFGFYLASGITLVLAFQTIIHMCVVFGLLPTKGLTLPFISSGGSALLINLFAVGVLLNISRTVNNAR